MPWWHLLAAAGPSPDLTPAAGAGTDITTYILGYGPVGVVAVLLAVVIVRGTFTLTSQADKRQAKQEAAYEAQIAQVRADWADERTRLTARAEKSEKQYDDLNRAVRDQVIPLMAGFETTANALLPVMRDGNRIAQEAYERGQQNPR